MTCGTLRQPCAAHNFTVLGSRVKESDVMWRGLDWSKVRTDSGPHALHPEAIGYLHVAWCYPGEEGMEWWEGVECRVRYDGWLGKRINVGGRYAWIVSIHAERGESGAWEWVIGYETRKVKQ